MSFSLGNILVEVLTRFIRLLPLVFGLWIAYRLRSVKALIVVIICQVGSVILGFGLGKILDGEMMVGARFSLIGIAIIFSPAAYVWRRNRMRTHKWSWEDRGLHMDFEFTAPPEMFKKLIDRIPKKPDEPTPRKPGESEKDYRKRMR